MLKIIEYTDKYKEQVVKLLIEVILNDLEMDWKIEDIKNYDYDSYKNGGGNLWIAINEKDEVKATIGIENNILKKEAKLVKLYCYKEYRGSGIATQMLNTAIEFVKNLSYNRITLGTYVNFCRAVNFYKKNGFKEYKVDGFYDDKARFYALEI